MSAALGVEKCATVGCDRKRVRHADGKCVHARCAECEARLLRVFA